VFVSLGLGSVIASAVEITPWLTTISHHKGTVFTAVGALLAVNYVLAVERPRRMRCAPGELCHVDSPAMRINRAMFWASAAIYFVAIAATYIAVLWLRVRS